MHLLGRFLLLNILLLLGLAAFSQDLSSIEGRITNSLDKSVLADVNVVLLNTPHGSATNSEGYYFIEKVLPGSYQMQVSALGFLTTVQEVQLESGQILSVHFELFSSSEVLDEIVVMIGGKDEAKTLPGSGYFISPQELEKFSYSDINRTLRSVPGINLQEEDGFGLRPNIGLRGTGVERSSKITVMEDGVLSAPAPYTAPAAYYFPTIGRMSAVEILKGSSQIKYGPYTTGGAINLVSTPLPNRLRGKVDLLGGSFGMRNIHAQLGTKHNNWRFLMETFQYGADGFKELDNGGNTGFYKQDYLTKLGWQSNADASIQQSFVLKVGHSQEESNETYLGLSESDFATNPLRRYSASQKDLMETQQWQYALNHTIRFKENIKVKTTAYRNTFSRNWYKLDKVTDDLGETTSISSILSDPASNLEAYNILTGESSTAGALLLKANNRSYYGEGVQSTFQYEYNSMHWNHKLELGMRIHRDGLDRFQWVDGYTMQNGTLVLENAGEPGTESNRLEDARAIAGFLNYELNWNRLTITPGLRYEHIILSRNDYGKNDPQRTGNDLSSRQNKVKEWIPGAAFNFELSENSDVFFGVHKGFAPPGSKEETESERSINYELGFRHNSEQFSVETILFANDYSNLLGSDLAASGGAGTQDLFNGGEVLTQGLELQASYDLLPKSDKFSLPLSLAYTFTKGNFQSDFDSSFDAWGEVSEGDELPYLAANQLNVLLSLESLKWNLNLSARYTDAMRTSPGQGAFLSSESTDSYLLIDASADYLLHKNLRLFMSATNLGNETYIVSLRPAGLRPGLPRAINFGLKASF